MVTDRFSTSVNHPLFLSLPQGWKGSGACCVCSAVPENTCMLRVLELSGVDGCVVLASSQFSLLAPNALNTLSVQCTIVQHDSLSLKKTHPLKDTPVILLEIMNEVHSPEMLHVWWMYLCYTLYNIQPIYS